jgi:diguanylate cyclase (GGDEF)-like protein
VTKNPEKQITPEEELNLLRRKLTKVELENSQLLAFLDEVCEREKLLKRAYAKLSENSMYSDVCTTLYNKRFFDQEGPRLIELERRHPANGGRYYGVVYVDLNHLKPVNGEFGHAGGNRSICAVGEKLLHIVRRSDIVAHLHGDEFVVLFFASTLKEGYKTYARINRAVRKVDVAFDDGRTTSLSAMTALAMRHVGDQVTLDEVCNKADLRMMAKKERRDSKMILGTEAREKTKVQIIMLEHS